VADDVLRLDQIAFRRAETEVLHGITWRVRPGEHWAVLGPNGSGKTTLIMIATGYQPSSRGRVFLLDGYISEIVLPQVRERIGLVSAALSDAMLQHRSSASSASRIAKSSTGPGTSWISSGSRIWPKRSMA
jgi:iron complex transport system ATP-binding protein